MLCLTRNEERDRLEYWNGTCKYYDKVEKQNAKFNELVSEQSKRTSLDAFYKVGILVCNSV